MNPTEIKIENQHFVFDKDLFQQCDPAWFDIDALKDQERIVGQARGRGNTYFVKIEDLTCALRHYKRGGWAAKITQDSYLWRNLFATRAWREWYLLGKLRTFDLNVPRPVAARVVRGKFFYSADILTVAIGQSISLSELLSVEKLTEDLWRKVGATIRRFHQRGVYHSDLNAHNILIKNKSDVYLIDFDKCYLRQTKRSWQLENLNRLKRSLQKLASNQAKFEYEESNWTELMAGYTQL